MPTYEYRCSKGHHFELFQRISEEPVKTCPECGAPAERQLSAGAGLIFKGSGFYITDYRSDTYKKAAQADSGTSSSSGESSSKSDSGSKSDSPSKSDSGSKSSSSDSKGSSGSSSSSGGTSKTE
jgi:putative FmdB family regulatory protein